jgi:hypothetical protein
MRITVLVVAISICFTTCKKDKPFHIDATKINFVDENGVSNGETDPTDWRFDDAWNGHETALFNFADSVSVVGMQKAVNCSADGFPNPTSSVITFYFSADKPTLLKMVITDEFLNIVFQKAVRLQNTGNVNPNIGISMDVRSSRFKQSGYYRVYYAFYAYDGFIYKKGHGDFQKL